MSLWVRGRLPRWRRTRHRTGTGLVGPARVGGRTLEVARRARPGDIAVVDHADIDGDSARALIAAGVAGLVNAAPAITGRYPTSGTTLLAQAGVAVLDAVGPEVLATVPDGAWVRLEHDTLWYGDRRVARGRPLDAPTATALAEASRQGLRSQLAAFSGAAADLLDADADLLLDATGLPRRQAWAGRDVLVVTSGPSAAAELRALRRFVRDRRPAVIAVGDAVAVARSAGLTPDALVADRVPAGRSLGDGLELVLVGCDGDFAEPDEPAEHAQTVLDPTPIRVRTRLGPEEAAVLLAIAGQARLVVLVGMPATLTGLLDREGAGPAALASTVLTRLAAGDRLVHAAVLAPVYEPATTAARGVLIGVSAVLALTLGLAAGLGPGSSLLDRVRAETGVAGQTRAPATPGGSAATASGPDDTAQAQRVDELVASTARNEAWMTGVGPALVAGRLAGRRVAVVTLPGADAAAVAAVIDAVRRAGATVTGTVVVSDRLLDPDRIGSVDDLVARLEATTSTGEAPERVAAALAGALLTRSAAALGAPSERATALLAGLAQLGMVTVEGDPARRGDLAVLVAGPATGVASGSPLAPAIARALAIAGRGTLVIGAADSDGLVATLRAATSPTARLSTLDDLRAPAGPITVVLALAELRSGGSGHYGSGVGAAAVPDLGSPTG